VTRRSGFSLIIMIPIVCTFLISVVFIAIGLYVAFEGARDLLTGKLYTELRPGLKFIEALDMFMIAFMFYIVSIGFSKLFLPEPVSSRLLGGLGPKWFTAPSFTKLKILLWEVLLTAVLIVFIGDVYRAQGAYSWSMLLIPAAIFLLSVGMFLMARGDREE